MIGKHLKVMSSTGPYMVNRVRNQKKFKKCIQLLNIVQKCNICNVGKLRVNKKYTLTPIEDSSWIGTDTRVYLFFFCNRYNLFYFSNYN